MDKWQKALESAAKQIDKEIPNPAERAASQRCIDGQKSRVRAWISYQLPMGQRPVFRRHCPISFY